MDGRADGVAVPGDAADIGVRAVTYTRTNKVRKWRWEGEGGGGAMTYTHKQGQEGIKKNYLYLGLCPKVLGQFGTMDNLAPWTIWHRGQFGTMDNLAP